MGVASLKIEGRMKRPEYVAAAVTACKNALEGKPYDMQTLKAVYACIGCVERCVATFDFSRGKREFLHMLSWRLRQCIIRCIAEG